MAGTRRGCGPGDAGYLEIKQLEARNNARLNRHRPSQTVENLVRWRLDELKLAMAISDWDGCLHECRRLSNLIGEVKQGRW
jgi:hypothetical protein